jgi:hypothetical protein
VHAAIGQQDLGLADAAGIKDDLAGRGIAGVVLVSEVFGASSSSKRAPKVNSLARMISWLI